MPTLSKRVQQTIRRSAGERFWVKKTLTSSALTTAAQDLTTAATGDLAVLQIILMTDATGLAGATNFEISQNGSKGKVNVAVETVANLGANVTKSYGGAPAGDTSSGDPGYTVTQAIVVLKAGKKLQYDGTSSAGTGAGTIDVFVQFERIDENAFCRAA